MQSKDLRKSKEKARIITDRLALLYPDAACTLDFQDSFQLLCATVLSAQTTDARVNTVTPELFSRFPDPFAMAEASLSDLEKILHPLGFFRAKARSLQGLAQGLVQNFAAQVPASLPELVSLPGVGRKTANVVLGNAFGIPGITVDTHVGRLVRRWEWTTEKAPERVEKDLQLLLPPEIWTVTCHRIIAHGRAVCRARRPLCSSCSLADICPSYNKF